MNHQTAKYLSLTHFILTIFCLTRYSDFICIKPLYRANYKLKKFTEFSSGFLNPLDVQSIVLKDSVFLFPDAILVFKEDKKFYVYLMSSMHLTVRVSQKPDICDIGLF